MEFQEIIKSSEKRLNKLKILNNFFDHIQIIVIYVRTKVIHDNFHENKDLDINKLELFHLQFTDTLLVLLTKLKKNIEKNYLQLNNEILINTDVVNSYLSEIKKDDFQDRLKTHNLIMQAFMKSLYNDLAFENKASKLTNLEEKNDLSNEMGSEFYRKITLQEFQQLNVIKSNSMYEFFDFKIEKKLLGKLNIQKFKFKFICGFQFNFQHIEIYEFIHSNKHFAFFKNKNEFLSIILDEFKNIDFSKNNSNKKEILLQLKIKNIELKEKAERIIKSIPMDIEKLLIEYYDKISTIEFLDELQNIDEQTNILRTMLNINIK